MFVSEGDIVSKKYKEMLGRVQEEFRQKRPEEWALLHDSALVCCSLHMQPLTS
jgi:hypothetical protein